MSKLHVWNNNKWVSISEANEVKQPDSILSDFHGEQIEDILESLFALLINKKVIKDMREFKEMFESIQLAKKLSEK